MRNRRDVAPLAPATAASATVAAPAAAANVTETPTPTPTLVINAGAVGDSAPVGLPKPDRPLLGVNGTGQRRPLLQAVAPAPVTTVKPTLVSEPISSDEQSKQDALYETVDVPSNDNATREEARKHNYTVEYKDVSALADALLDVDFLLGRFALFSSSSIIHPSTTNRKSRRHF